MNTTAAGRQQQHHHSSNQPEYGYLLGSIELGQNKKQQLSSTRSLYKSEPANNASQKRRKYSTRACMFCRNRHKKCDGGQPCIACEQRKQDCVYPEHQKKRGPKPRSTHSVLTPTIPESLNGVVIDVHSHPARSHHSPPTTTISKNGKTHLPSNRKSSGDGEFRRPKDLVVKPNPTATISEENIIHGKAKRRRLSNRSEERIPEVREVYNEDQINLCHALEEVLHLIGQHPRAYPFLQPVSISDAPDYYEIILQPMDFGTILKRVKSFQYNNIEQFYSDVDIIVNNCRQYNQNTRSEFLINWILELQHIIVDEIQKRTIREEETLWSHPQTFEPIIDNTNNAISNTFYEIEYPATHFIQYEPPPFITAPSSPQQGTVYVPQVPKYSPTLMNTISNNNSTMTPTIDHWSIYGNQQDQFQDQESFDFEQLEYENQSSHYDIFIEAMDSFSSSYDDQDMNSPSYGENEYKWY